MSANPHANGGLLRKELKLPDFRHYAVDVPSRGTVEVREHQAARRVPARRHEEQPDQLPRVRAGRDRVEPAAGGLRGEQEDLDGRHAAGGRRRRRAGARRPRDGDAVRAHAARLARGLSAHRPARVLPHLRGVRARHRLDVQPARQVAGHLARTTCRGAPRSRRRTSCCRRRSGGRITTGSRTRIPGFIDLVTNKGPSVVAHLPAARRQHAAVGRRSLPAQHRLHQRHRRRQAEAPAVHHHRRGDRRTAPRASASGRARAPTPARSRTSCWRPAATSRRWRRWPRRRSCASGCPT